MRIHQHQDGSHTIDQSLFTQTIIRKFCPNTAPYGMPKHQDTPAPENYRVQKANHPIDEEK